MASRFDFLKVLDNSEVDFKEEFDKVILWNAIAQNGKHDFSLKAITRQYSLCEEEFKELHQAVDTNDLVETVDALCDLFVVCSYYLFLIGQTPSTCGFVINFDEAVEQCYYPMRDYNLNKINIAYLFGDVLKALASMHKGKECLNNVLDSNMSKFALKGFLEDSCCDMFVTAQVIEKQSDRRYKNVVPIVSSVVDKETQKELEYVVFRAEYGNGKIIKPPYFIEPKIKEIIKDFI